MGRKKTLDGMYVWAGVRMWRAFVDIMCEFTANRSRCPLSSRRRSNWHTSMDHLAPPPDWPTGATSVFTAPILCLHIATPTLPFSIAPDRNADSNYSIQLQKCAALYEATHAVKNTCSVIAAPPPCRSPANQNAPHE